MYAYVIAAARFVSRCRVVSKIIEVTQPCGFVLPVNLVVRAFALLAAIWATCGDS
jgi:hypothetical protein